MSPCVPGRREQPQLTRLGRGDREYGFTVRATCNLLLWEFLGGEFAVPPSLEGWIDIYLDAADGFALMVLCRDGDRGRLSRLRQPPFRLHYQANVGCRY